MKADKGVIEWDSEQRLMSPTIIDTEPGTYNLYPHFPIDDGKIERGYDVIAESFAQYSCIVIDGYIGVFWDHFKEQIQDELYKLGLSSTWIDVADYMLPEDQIKELKSPYLGGDDPIFGTRYEGELGDFFETEKLKALAPDQTEDICVLYGCGAALSEWDAPLVYVDLPKNELQYRSRAGSITNLGHTKAQKPKSMYKEYYFVDWIVLNKVKAELVDKVDFVIDEQRVDDPAIISGNAFRNALETISQNVFRVRPWFEPGVWGGQWCMKHIPQLPQNVPNYAWSFEMIVPENGLVLSSSEQVLEISFDWLMFRHHEEVLGDSASRFGYEFPIRFDFLDTYDGGNLSLQCHPRTEYIQNHFGETFTQDETYYILDCKEDTGVYLGFQDNIDPSEFRYELENGAQNGDKVEVDKYVLKHKAEKHDLFLIPSGTVHCSGVNILVLEISATPYIFTFKMYDWQRVDLEGNPRPINIERAFENLQFKRKGRNKIEEEFISSPKVIGTGDDWQLVHLPTHPEHFYDIHRYDFENEVAVETDGSCHVMNLVEGSSIIVETSNGVKQRFNYAETFAIPAAAKKYKMINEGNEIAKVVKAYIK